MTTPKHTKGPWASRYTFTSNSKTLRVFPPDDLAVATVPLYGDQERAEANANLIASAPDLLAALERAESILSKITLGFGTRDGETLIAARAAIALAKGEPA